MSAMTDAFVLGGVRTPVGRYGGSLSHIRTDDLLGLCCRPTAFGRTRRDEYEARVASKRWRELWPKVRFLD